MKTLSPGILVVSLLSIFLSGCGGAFIKPLTVAASVNCSSASILTTGTTTCSAAVQVQEGGNYNSTTSWSATNGTITPLGVFTPTAAGTATITANVTVTSGIFSGQGSGAAAIAVTQPPSITSVSVICSPASIKANETSTCTSAVAGTGMFASGVNWSVSPSSVGSISSAGVFTPASAGTATITATSAQDSTKLGSATVLVTALPTVTSVSVVCTPPSIQTAQTSQCTATVSGTGSYSSAVNWSVNATLGGSSTLGTISSTGLYTAPTTIPASATAVTVLASSQSNASITDSASISLSYPSPTVLSLSPQAVNADSSDTVVTVQGSNFTAASTADLGGIPIPTSFVSSTALQATIPASSLKLAGQLYLNVTNPAPGGGSSASALVTVVPQLIAVAPSAAPVGGVVTLQMTGVDNSNISSVAVSFAQVGQTFSPANGTLTTSGGTAQLTLVVPSGLAPASMTASISAPAQITATVGSIPSPTDLSFTVQPPTHAGVISPATVQTGLSVQASFTGVTTAFDGTTTITSDDPQITFEGATANSSTILLANMKVGSGARTGAHTVNVSAGGQMLAYALQIASPAAAPVIQVSPSFGAPAAAITIKGSGIAGAGTGVVLAYSYAGVEVDTPATTAAADEIDTFMPVLFDPSTGALYSGPVEVAVQVNGQSSNSAAVTMLTLPANASAVGTSTLTAIDAAIASATSAEGQLASTNMLPADQAQSATAHFSAILGNLTTLRANVVSAVNGQAITNSDGTIFDAGAVDILDRLLQSAGSRGGLTPASALGGVHPFAQDNFLNTDTDMATQGKSCSAFDSLTLFHEYFDEATSLVCLSALIPGAGAVSGPICAVMKVVSTGTEAISVLGNVLCDSSPVTLASIAASPSSINTFVNGPAVIEIPQGTFESNPHQARNAVAGLTELFIDAVGGSKGITKLLLNSGVNKITAKQVTKQIEDVIGNIVELVVDKVAPSWGRPNIKTVPLTSATTSLMQDPGGVVSTSGLTVIPGPQAGQTNLMFNTSAFRMLDANSNLITDSLFVAGNLLPVNVGSFVVSPSAATVAPGATQQFTVTSNGLSNTLVIWSVNGVEGGDSTVGTITSQGSYTAPGAVPSPAVVTVTATDLAFPGVTGSSQVTISSPSVIVTPSSAVVEAGENQQLIATVTGASNTAVNWSVSGITGGNSTVGTISDQGLYTAPVTIPSPASVSVAATSQADSNVSGQATITITSSSPNEPAVIVTLPVTDVTSTSAVLNCSASRNAIPLLFGWGVTPQRTFYWNTYVPILSGCSAVLTGLAPNTTYYYQPGGNNAIIGADDPWGATLSFKTLP